MRNAREQSVSVMWGSDMISLRRIEIRQANWLIKRSWGQVAQIQSAINIIVDVGQPCQLGAWSGLMPLANMGVMVCKLSMLKRNHQGLLPCECLYPDCCALRSNISFCLP